MNCFQIDFSQTKGTMKPMHSVNNGPAGVRGMSNAHLFTQAGIPYARLHDSGFFAGYGGAHSVDVAALFPRFEADVNDPASYDFTLTDEYLKSIDATGTKIFYRLGNKIEHEIKKYGTRVPENFQKWAEICEHIIRHYNEGWADGLRLGIDYWEIWNEPDCRNADGSNPCWQGTEEEFCELFYVAQKHLKRCFPRLKIGGPAFCYVNVPFAEKLLSRLTRDGEHVPLDFFSFHGYNNTPEGYRNAPGQARELLDRFGYADTEIILNEWNYVSHWQPAEEIKYTYRVLKSLKGASFIASSMCVCQDTPLDHFMYYDARPCSWNGLFDTGTLEPLKGYYAFLMFNELFRLQTEVSACAQAPFYGCAASDGERSAAMLSYFRDKDDAPAEEVLIDMKGLPGKAEISYFMLDETNDLTLFRTDTVYGGRFATVMSMGLFSSLLIKVRALAD